ncbi:MAG: 2-succinyl-6-hydroxy-2,4-cyclohexadiene-1-carboxylate synthase [Cyanobacteria bacterium J06598_1]
MPLFSTEHHTLHYITQGDRTNPPILLLHGFLGSHQDFASLLPNLSRHFYCITPDLPGHGRTKTQPNRYTFTSTTDTLLALLHHLNIQQTHLLGYSMGGRLALYMVCEFPKCFIRVVLESASPGLETAEEREKRAQSDDAIAHRLETTPLPQFLTQWYQNPLFTSTLNKPDIYTAMIQRRQNNAPSELARALQGFSTGRQPSLWAKLSDIKAVPLLLIVGILDTKFVAINRNILKQPGSKARTKLEIVDECGHNVHLEAPNAYAKAVISFLN